jgi:endonuclease/exonuclease/phosphatase family metal-dependent hydrolase
LECPSTGHRAFCNFTTWEIVVKTSWVLIWVLTLSGSYAHAQPGIEVREGERIRITTWNLKWFFDADTSDNDSDTAKKNSADSNSEYRGRVKKIAKAIADLRPTVLALQEIENQKVVQDLCNELKAKHDRDYRVGFVQGKDPHTEQDVALLYEDREGAVNIERVENAIDKDFSNKQLFKVPSKHVAMTVQRRAGDKVYKLTIINVHFKAGKKTGDVAQRKKQARVMNVWAEKLLDKGHAVIMLGDFNVRIPFRKNGPNTEMGIAMGMDSRTPDDDLEDMHGDLPRRYRNTHPLGHLDRILLSANLLDDQGLVLDRMFTHAAIGKRRLSDHTPLSCTFTYIP